MGHVDFIKVYFLFPKCVKLVKRILKMCIKCRVWGAPLSCQALGLGVGSMIGGRKRWGGEPRGKQQHNQAVGSPSFKWGLLKSNRLLMIKDLVTIKTGRQEMGIAGEPYINGNPVATRGQREWQNGNNLNNHGSHSLWLRPKGFRACPFVM